MALCGHAEKTAIYTPRRLGVTSPAHTSSGSASMDWRQWMSAVEAFWGCGMLLWLQQTNIHPISNKTFFSYPPFLCMKCQAFGPRLTWWRWTQTLQGKDPKCTQELLSLTVGASVQWPWLPSVHLFLASPHGEALKPSHIVLGWRQEGGQRRLLTTGQPQALHLSVGIQPMWAVLKSHSWLPCIAVHWPERFSLYSSVSLPWALNMALVIDVFPAPGPVPGVKWLNVITSIE